MARKFFAALNLMIMITLKLTLDTRTVKQDGTSPLKFLLCSMRKAAYLSIGLYVPANKWNSTTCALIDTNDPLDKKIAQLKLRAQLALLDITNSGDLPGLSILDIRDRLHDALFGVTPKDPPKTPTFREWFLKFEKSRSAEGTRYLYSRTLVAIEKFAKVSKFNLKTLKFEDITVAWLKRFEDFLKETSPSPNARNIHFRNIRAVFNDAIADDLITCYPFRRFRLHYVATKKRNMPVDELRRFWFMKLDDPRLHRAQVYFKLMFCLIGINTADLAKAKEIVDGRLNYIRCKTHRAYSIKVEPEALELINEVKGKNQLVDILDHNHDYLVFTSHLSKMLKKIGGNLVHNPSNGKDYYTIGPWPHLSAYWARHTWATIAYTKCGASKDDVAAALGHVDRDHKITDVYIEFDPEQVDRLNRRVLDYVLYSKD